MWWEFPRTDAHSHYIIAGNLHSPALTCKGSVFWPTETLICSIRLEDRNLTDKFCISVCAFRSVAPSQYRATSKDVGIWLTFRILVSVWLLLGFWALACSCDSGNWLSPLVITYDIYAFTVRLWIRPSIGQTERILVSGLNVYSQGSVLWFTLSILVSGLLLGFRLWSLTTLISIMHYCLWQIPCIGLAYKILRFRHL